MLTVFKLHSNLRFHSQCSPFFSASQANKDRVQITGLLSTLPAKLKGCVYPDKDAVLTVLSKIDKKAFVYKYPREGLRDDAMIFKFTFNNKVYGLKFFPDTWPNSAAIYQPKWKSKVLALNLSTKVITSFITPSENRFVLYEYAEGRSLKLKDLNNPTILTNLAKLLKAFADIGLCAGSRLDDYLLIDDNQVIMSDWDGLKQVGLTRYLKKISYNSAVRYICWSNPAMDKSIQVPKYGDII